MTKKEAIKAMIDGKKVWHPTWQEGEYIYIKDENMSIYDEDDQYFNWKWFWKLKQDRYWNKSWEIVD